MKIFSINKIKRCASLLRQAFELTPDSLEDQAKIDEIKECCKEVGFRDDNGDKITDCESVGKKLNWDCTTAFFWNTIVQYNKVDGFEKMVQLLIRCRDNIPTSGDFLKTTETKSAFFIDYVHYIWAFAFFGDENGNNERLERKYNMDAFAPYYIRNLVKGFTRTNGDIKQFNEADIIQKIDEIDKQLIHWSNQIAKLRDLYSKYGVADSVSTDDTRREFEQTIKKISREEHDKIGCGEYVHDYGVRTEGALIFSHDVDRLFGFYVKEGKRIQRAFNRIKVPHIKALTHKQSFVKFYAECDETEKLFRSADLVTNEEYKRRMGELQSVNDNVIIAKNQLNLSSLFWGEKAVFQMRGCRKNPDLVKKINEAKSFEEALQVIDGVSPAFTPSPDSRDSLEVPPEFWSDIVAYAESIIEISGEIKGVEDRLYKVQLLGAERGFEDTVKRYDSKYDELADRLKSLCGDIGPIATEKLTRERCEALGIAYSEGGDGIQKLWLEYRDDAEGIKDILSGIFGEITDTVQSINDYSNTYKFNTLEALEAAFNRTGDSVHRDSVLSLKSRIQNFSVRYNCSKLEELKKDVARLVEFMTVEVIPGLKSRVAENSEKEKTITAFDRNKQKFVLQCRLMEEDRAEIDTDTHGESGKKLEVYDYAYYHDLMDAAINVRKQPVFCDYDDITSYPYFKPFRYQIDSVRTMLSRFEGRGIYGDQVGLGKTLQTLMTADVMHRCRTIENALVFVPPKLVQQWRKECETKFRNENGECIFDVYPQNANYKYKFEDLLEIFSKEGKGKRKTKDKNKKGDQEEKEEKKLKIYIVSDAVLSSASRRIEQATFANNWLYEYDRSYTDLPENLNIFTDDPDEFAKIIERTHNRTLLNIMEDELKAAYETTYKKDVIPKFSSFTYVDESNILTPRGELLVAALDRTLTEKYNAKLRLIFDRLGAIEGEHENYMRQDLYRDLAVDLLIFDEVDRLIRANDKANKEEEDEDESIKEKDITTVQEFLSRLEKKFCILASATPIRTDLSDIFNLLYIVDRNKLGDTREIAENRFYNIYCGGSRSLSEMAADKNVESKLQVLNGLINSMFTRKRVSDPDVRESMRRQCSTPEEIREAEEITASAKAAGMDGYERDDYGGNRFLQLARLLSVVYDNVILGRGAGDSNGKNERGQYLFTEEPYMNEFFANADFLCGAERTLPDEQKEKIVAKRRIVCLEDMVKSIADSYRMQIEKQRITMNATDEALDRIFAVNNPCDLFCNNFERLRGKELHGDYDTMLLKNCNLQCSFINRGLLDFSRAKHDYPTVFLADYLDWRRPVKRDVVVPIETRDQKIAVIGDLLIRDESRNQVVKSLGLTENDVQAVLTSKAIVFEKESELRAKIYRELCAIALNERHKSADERDADKARQTEGRREVYINLDDEQVKKQNYTAEELLDLGYFYRGDKDAPNSGYNIYNKIINKKRKKETLSLDEERFISIYNERGQVISEIVEDGANYRVLSSKSFGELNYKWFTRFMIENGNWNAVYFIDNNQLAGTDLNAANILVVSNLDYYREKEGIKYLDPLDMEQLIGRISRTGQTEECVVYSMLYSGLKDCDKKTSEFNAIYYDILKDRKGFDLFAACKTEVDFVVPVVMACARQLFSLEGSYLQSAIEKDGEKYSAFSVDRTPFIAVYRDREFSVNSIRATKAVLTATYKRFPDILKFAYDNMDKIYVVRNYTDTDGKHKCENILPTDAIKYMVRLYAKLLGHESKSEE